MRAASPQLKRRSFQFQRGPGGGIYDKLEATPSAEAGRLRGGEVREVMNISGEQIICIGRNGCHDHRFILSCVPFNGWPLGFISLGRNEFGFGSHRQRQAHPEVSQKVWIQSIFEQAFLDEPSVGLLSEIPLFPHEFG